MKNLVNGGFEGEIYPVNPKAGEILGKKAYADVTDLPDGVDVAVFCIPAKFVRRHARQGRRQGHRRRRADPLRLRRDRRGRSSSSELVETAREHGVRFIGPNIYGVYYTPEQDERGLHHALRRPGAGRAGVPERRHRHGHPRLQPLDEARRVGDRRARQQGRHRRGRPADVLRAGRRTPMHRAPHGGPEGRPLVRRGRQAVSKKKPIVVLKAGATPAGSKAAASHTAALAGDDKVYDDILRQAGVVRARGLHELLQFARCLPDPPDAPGRERRDHHGRRRLGRAAVGRLLQQRAHS